MSDNFTLDQFRDLLTKAKGGVVLESWQAPSDPGNAPGPMKDPFQDLYDRAVWAGNKAAYERKPTPMVVGEATDLFSDEIDFNKPVSFVPDGVCGFAWVVIRPGTSRFARWLKAQGLARRDDYYGGVTVWVSDFNQSYELKSAFAHAFARVLTADPLCEGMRIHSMSRLD